MAESHGRRVGQSPVRCRCTFTGRTPSQLALLRTWAARSYEDWPWNHRNHPTRLLKHREEGHVMGSSIFFYMSLYVFICFYMSLFSWNFRNGLDVCIYIYIYPLGWWFHGISSEEVLAAQLGTNLSWQCGNKGSATGFRLHPVRIERHACHSWGMVLTISFASNLKVVASQVQLFPCSATSPGVVICPFFFVRLRLYWTTLLAHRWRCRALEHRFFGSAQPGWRDDAVAFCWWDTLIDLHRHMMTYKHIHDRYIGIEDIDIDGIGISRRSHTHTYAWRTHILYIQYIHTDMHMISIYINFLHTTWVCIQPTLKRI